MNRENRLTHQQHNDPRHRSISSTMVYVGTTDAQAAEALQAALMGAFRTTQE